MSTAQSALLTALALFVPGAAAVLAEGSLDGPLIIHEDSSHYSYRLTLLPDVDQRRLELPNEGDMYCVPTAVLNLCAYAGSQGFEDEVLCDNVWWLYYHWPAFYDDVTDLDALIGTYMGTDPYDGTTGATGPLGAIITMGGGFTVKHVTRNSSHWPRFDNMAGWALSGALIAPVVGWYPPGSGSRDGGHALTAARLQRNGDLRLLGVHDPATGDGFLSQQSPVTREDYGIVSEIVIWQGVPRLVDRVEGLGSGGNVALIDGYYAFLPHHAYTFDPATSLVEPVVPGPWSFGEPIQVLPWGAILQLQQDSLTGMLYVLQENDLASQLIQIDTLGKSQHAVLEVPGMQDFIVTPFQRAYVLSNYTTLTCYRIRGDQLIEQVSVETPAPMSTIAYDHWADEVVGVSAETQQIITWESDLVAAPRLSGLPAPMFQDPVVAVNPVDGTIWLTSADAEHIWGIDRDGPPIIVIEHPIIEGGQSLSLTPDGNVLFGDGSATHEFTPAGALVQPSKWAILNGAPAFMPSYETNVDESMTGPEWNNVQPDTFAPSIPGCVADFDGDDQVGVCDLLALLGRWGSSSMAGDITMDGVIDVSDMLVMLAAWGDCP